MSSEWKHTRLVDVAAIRNGAGVKQEFFAPEGIPLARVTNFTDNSIDLIDSVKVDLEHAKKWEGHRLAIGDTLVATVGSWPPNWASVVGKAVIVPHTAQGAIQNQNTCCIRANEGKAIQRFLYYRLKSEDFAHYAANSASGSANQARLSVSKLESFTFNLPSLEEQESIAALLGSLDDRITLLRETNATLEAIAQTLFKSWFVDFDPVHAKIAGRAPEGMDEATAALFPDGFEESALGLVPRGWLVSSLGEVCSYLNRGISPKYLEEDGVLVLNQKCIRDFSVDYNKGRRHDPIQRKIVGREISVGDVLVNSTGVGTLGRVAQVLELPEETVIVDSHVTVVRAGAAISWPYLGQFIACRQPEIEAMGEGSTGQTELSRSKLAEIRVLVPPTDLLECFDQIVIPLKKRVALNEAKTRTLANLRDTLLPRLISGQLRLPDAATLLEQAS